MKVTKPSWTSWLAKRRETRLKRLVHKRAVIMREGIFIYATILDCYDTGIRCADDKLIRVRLQINFAGNKSLFPFSYTFFMGNCTVLKGARVRVQLLVEDLSLIVIRI